MSEENQEWQAPPPPESMKIVDTNVPQMSLFQTLTDIYFDPGKVFEDLRRKPFARFLFPLLFCAVLIVVSSFLLIQKVGYERMIREQINSPMMESVPEEAKTKMREDAKNVTLATIVFQSAIGGIGFLVIYAILGLIYWGGSLAMGGNGNYLHGLAVATYSTFPVMLITVIGTLIILALKNGEEISIKEAQGGLLHLNLGFLFEGSKVLSSIVSRFDLFVFWGMFLSVIGMKNCFKLSSGGAWGIAIFIWLIGTFFTVLAGMFS